MTMQIAKGRHLYTAGTEGQIRAWVLPAQNEVNPYGDTFNGRNYCVGIWGEHGSEPIWDLAHHKVEDLLLSAEANDKVSLWNTERVN